MKRFVSLALCLILTLCLCSCGGDVLGEVTQKNVAVEYSSANELAAEELVQQGYTKVTYTSSEEVVLAVENGRAQCGVVNEFELNSYVSAERSIKKSQKCSYSIDYCIYFSADNEELQKEFNEAIDKLKSDGTLDEIKEYAIKGKSYPTATTKGENGTLTMLCDPHFDKFVYTDDKGNVKGLDVDTATAICSYLGYELEISTGDFNELFEDLQNGDGDFIISACEVDKDREEYYWLSDPYFTLNFYSIERK